jgi:predicted RNA binding protein YcfA (HicA-like mRNA interferase family)
LPRLKCTFREFVDIIEGHGFISHRHEGTSHRQYRGIVDGKVRMVTVAYHHINDDILAETLASMIHQSGLRKSPFRK